MMVNTGPRPQPGTEHLTCALILCPTDSLDGSPFLGLILWPMKQGKLHGDFYPASSCKKRVLKKLIEKTMVSPLVDDVSCVCVCVCRPPEVLSVKNMGEEFLIE